jgi:hypothetical protein
MFTQRQQFTDTHGVWILVIAFLAAVVLFGGAFFFGTVLSADTVESVAPSPLGSSLTNVRESVPADYVERLSNASAVASSASAGLSTADYASFGLPAFAAARSASPAASRFADRYDRMSSSSVAATSASQKALDERWAAFYAGLDKAMTAAKARPSQGSSSSIVESSAADQSPWIKPEGVKPSAAAGSAADESPWIKPEGIRAN